ncbi:MAG: glycosyltransferase family 2 protein [Bacteroidales bacterium]|nr:glycosyltransferase family 2 protein [Bacteroidales bacterium]
MKKVSIIAPCYNESQALTFFYKELKMHLPEIYKYEIILVNDGSKDDTLEIIKNIAANDSSVHFISFSRNFGHQNALKAGFDLASGDCAICLDSDLQHPPQLIPLFLEKWEQGYESVYTKRMNHDSISFFKKTTSKMFYKLTNRLSDIKLEDGVADFRLLDRKVVDALKDFTENHIFLRAVIQWLGFKQIMIEYKAAERIAGESKYTIRKMFSFALSGITAFSIKPLRFSIYLGSIIASLAFLYGVYALVINIFTDRAIQGWTSILMSVLFIGGLNLLMLGIIGEYLGKLFIENKKRPNYIISETDLIG